MFRTKQKQTFNRNICSMIMSCSRGTHGEHVCALKIKHLVLRVKNVCEATHVLVCGLTPTSPSLYKHGAITSSEYNDGHELKPVLCKHPVRFGSGL